MNCKPDEPLKVFRAEPPKQVIIEEEENNYIAIKIPPLSLRVEKSKAAEKKSKWWQIRALVEEPKVIRDEHLWELEILFNYCFSMTGAILPANTSKPRKRRKLKYK